MRMSPEREAELRARFQIPGAYGPGFEADGKAWFSFCDHSIDINLESMTATETWMAYDHDVGHYFKTVKWPPLEEQ